MEKRRKRKEKVDKDLAILEELENVDEQERYRLIVKLENPQNIANALNSLGDISTKQKTFNFVIKKFKGNSKGFLEILRQIDFDVNIPKSMLKLKLNNLNPLDLDLLIEIQRKVGNFTKISFEMNKDNYTIDKGVIYSFGEMSAIIAKMEELTGDITEDMSEADKFYRIYSRLTQMITYDHGNIRKVDKMEREYQEWYREYLESEEPIYRVIHEEEIRHKEQIRAARKKAAGMYGGLVNGTSICSGYAMIFHEAIQYIGMKSRIITADNKTIDEDGHEWNQVQIDGKWYNVDVTYDAGQFAINGRYKYMLKSDKEFEKSHSEFYIISKRQECNSDFDYDKITGEVPIERERAA